MTRTDPQFSEDDCAYMKMALDLSRGGLGRVHPNPSVGCIIVKNNHIIARGVTGDGGRPHAETTALTRTEDTQGATVYVTLEPCAHHGKTPPCAEALVAAKIERVVIATGDPDPRVSGDGIRILKDAGIKVDFGLMKEEADRINQGFFQRFKEKRPLVTVKIASSFDGKISTKVGEKSWVTGPHSRRRGHLLRANHDAIMVGIGTALIDDPSLSCRIDGLEHYSPIRVVVDTDLRISPDSMLCRSAKKKPLWIMTSSFDEQKYQTLEKMGVRIFCLEKDENDQVDLNQVMSVLVGQGVTRVLSEGGGKLNASLIKASLVDRLIWFKSADSIGENGVDALYDVAVNELHQYLDLALMDEGETPPDHWQEFEVIR